MLLPVKSLGQFSRGSVPVTVKTISEICSRNAQAQGQHYRSLRAYLGICSPWKDVQRQIKIAIRLAVPRKPYSLLLASYTITEERRLPLKFLHAAATYIISLCIS